MDTTLQQIPLDRIDPDPEQPRRSFDESTLQELAASIREHGVLQPITLDANGNDRYVIRMGERRWRAAALAGLKEIPALVRVRGRGTKDQHLVHALVENLQREDLNPIDEGHAYQQLHEAGHSHNKIARMTARSAMHIASRLKLLELDPEIQQLIAAGQFSKSAEVAEALLLILDRETRVRYATEASRRRFSNKSVIIGCRRIVAALEVQQLEKQKTPSMAFAIKRRPAEWNMLQQVALSVEGRMPAWKTVRQAADATCAACNLRDVASVQICNSCPGVDIIAHMIEIEANRARK